MKAGPEPKPIAFEVARRTVTATLSVDVADSGSRIPTITLGTVPVTPMRTLNAAAHYLALLAELGSGPADQWAIGIEVDRLNVARVFVETVSNTDDEVARARTVLEDVLVAAQLARPVPPS